MLNLLTTVESSYAYSEGTITNNSASAATITIPKSQKALVCSCRGQGDGAATNCYFWDGSTLTQIQTLRNPSSVNPCAIYANVSGDNVVFSKNSTTCNYYFFTILVD